MLLALVNLAQPGIFKHGDLLAVTGERMNMNAYTEICSVITHPEQTRKGYARQLVDHVSQRICEQSKTPFLHVADTNSSAITLYKKLGFVHRRTISFWNIGLR